MIGIYPATTNNVLVYFASGPSRYEATTKFKSVEAGKSYFFNAKAFKGPTPPCKTKKINNLNINNIIDFQ